MSETAETDPRIAELESWREGAGLNYTQAATALGYKSDSAYSRAVTGERKIGDAFWGRFERVRQGLPPTEDLPPLAEEGAPFEEGEESIFVQAKAGGKSVTVKSMGHFEKIEVNMFVFFAGKEIEYRYPNPKGGYLTGTTHQPGLADILPPRDGAVIRDKAAEMAHAWADWARTNPRVHAFLSFFTIEGGFRGVVAVTAPVILTILGNHGIDPVGFFLRPLHESQLPPRAPDDEQRYADTDFFAAANGDGAVS